MRTTFDSSMPVSEETGVRRRVRLVPSLASLLSDVTDRRPLPASDGLSGSRLEMVVAAGEQCVLKHISLDDDWIMRASGDFGCRQLALFSSHALDALPEHIDHTVIACAAQTTPRGRRGCALLMEDVAGYLVPSGSAPIALEEHRTFIAHMAEMHAAYWGWRDDVGLFPLMHHYVLLTPTMAALERDGQDAVPKYVAAGWAEMHRAFPAQAAILADLAADPSPLARSLSATPQTFIHADWKLGNLGRRPDGRTVLLDWDRCGEGPAAFDIAWYLAVNCDRLPESKEDTIAAYRRALQDNDVDVSYWWAPQLAVSLVGAFLMLGWSKTDDREEFGWWSDRLTEGLRSL